MQLSEDNCITAPIQPKVALPRSDCEVKLNFEWYNQLIVQQEGEAILDVNDGPRSQPKRKYDRLCTIEPEGIDVIVKLTKVLL